MAKEIVVDLWKTGAHSVEIGIKKKEVQRAKSRQFTSDTDIIGEYKSDTNGFITMRETPWKTGEESQRLILKLFTESMNWKGSFEEMVALSQARTIACGEGMPVFTANLTNLDHLVMVERIFKPKSMNKAMFSFMIIDDDQLEAYHIEADRLTLGSDWTVMNQHGQKVAEIDGSKFNIGGKWKIKIDEKYKVHPALDEILILFAAFSKYEEEIRKRLESNAKKLEKTKDKFEMKIATDEINLYENPRRMKV